MGAIAAGMPELHDSSALGPFPVGARRCAFSEDSQICNNCRKTMAMLPAI
jgi:hypothetical protein